MLFALIATIYNSESLLATTPFSLPMVSFGLPSSSHRLTCGLTKDPSYCLPITLCITFNLNLSQLGEKFSARVPWALLNCLVYYRLRFLSRLGFLLELGELQRFDICLVS
ncbi:hypothetical protein O6H91_18G073900 [Diphasiastrum complanatum]|uniref:Uncharacterized protein n=1 Tax=Diphasiastrum complanatum TaxID=34168 RepID=A0ACC2B3U1_DIPCM|nr:hypothetical protein O6H91_18G073900 [Diphasiastrum complanatum]